MGMTKTQKALYDAIQEYIQVKGYSPSVRDLCDAIGNKSTNTVHQKLHILRRKGYISFDDGVSRSIVIRK